jgi:pimeloyl-ACP methyl ester carboxylesterase
LHDVEQAIDRLPSLVRQHDGRVILVGHSAGGHLALCAGASSPRGHIGGVLALAPLADLQLAERLNLGEGAVGLFLGASAQSRTDLDPAVLRDPKAPVTIVHGAADDTVPVSVSRSYGAAHAQARLVQLPGAGHFALIDPLSVAWLQVQAELRHLCR